MTKLCHKCFSKLDRLLLLHRFCLEVWCWTSTKCPWSVCILQMQHDAGMTILYSHYTKIYMIRIKILGVLRCSFASCWNCVKQGCFLLLLTKSELCNHSYLWNSAPLRRSSSTTLTWPPRDARCSGVSPFSSPSFSSLVSVTISRILWHVLILPNLNRYRKWCT